MGIIFSNNIQKTLKEAKLFHEKIIENRRNFLNVEIIEVTKQIEENEKKLLKKE